MSLVQHLVALAARISLSAFFLWNGATQIIFYWADTLNDLKGRGVMYPDLLLLLAVIAMLLGGLSLVAGLRTRSGALLLILLLIPATLVLRNFWVHDPASPEYAAAALEFLKNVSLLGGLLMILAFGPGGFSADTFLRKRPPEAR